jgi:hypothetical protein
MIIIINGPSGVGKTATSWELLYQTPSTVMLDMDFVGWAFHSFDCSNRQHLDYSYSTLVVLITNHIQNGFQNFIVSGVFESPEELNQIHNTLSAFNLPIKDFCIWCDAMELSYRVKMRSRSNLTEELNHSQKLFESMESPLMRGDMGIAINNTQLSAKETGDIILDYLRQS